MVGLAKLHLVQLASIKLTSAGTLAKCTAVYIAGTDALADFLYI